jgi:hypothetical protein
LLKVRPSSLFIVCWCISCSIASLMSRSMYPVLAERSFVSCNLIMWSRLMLRSAAADLSSYASIIYLLCSLIRSWTDRPLCSIQNLPHSHGMLYIPGVLKPNAPLTGGRWLNIFLGGKATLLMLCLVRILLSRLKVVCVYGTYAVEAGLWLVVFVVSCIHCS